MGMGSNHAANLAEVILKNQESVDFISLYDMDRFCRLQRYGMEEQISVQSRSHTKDTNE